MSAGADRGGLRISLALLVYLAAFLSTLALAHPVLTDQDPFWHIAAGNWIIEHRAIPHRDVFSNSMPGAPWVAHEWLAEVVIALVYDHLGWAGLVVMTGLVFAAALALLTRFLLRFLAPLYVIPLVLGAWGLCLAHLHARPHVFGLPLLVIWFALLDRKRLEERIPSVLLAAIIVLWANLHGGYMLALALAALLAGEALLDAPDRPRFMTALRGWGGFLLVALLAALITPNGIQGLMLPFTIMQSSFADAMIGEWKSPDFQMLQPLELWMLLGLLGILSLRVAAADCTHRHPVRPLALGAGASALRRGPGPDRAAADRTCLGDAARERRRSRACAASQARSRSPRAPVASHWRPWS